MEMVLRAHDAISSRDCVLPTRRRAAVRSRAAPTAEASLIIEVVGFTDATGNATLSLFASEDDFKSTDVRKGSKNVLKYFRSLQDTQIVCVGTNMVAMLRSTS